MHPLVCLGPAGTQEELHHSAELLLLLLKQAEQAGPLMQLDTAPSSSPVCHKNAGRNMRMPVQCPTASLP